MSKAVREAGVSVALSGIGGDEVFAGYAAFHAFRTAGRLAPFLRKMTSGHAWAGWPAATMSVQKALALLASKGEPFAMYSALRGMFLPHQRSTLLPASECTRVAPTVFDAEISAWAAGRNGDFVNAYSLFEITNYLRNTLLRDTDVMSMAHGLEVREPLLDHRLVERVLTLPGPMKLFGRTNKPLLVDAVSALKNSAPRAKMGFTLPLQTWLGGALRGWAHEQLEGSELIAENAIDRMWSAFDEGRLSYSRMWTLIALLGWTRRNGVALAA